MAKQNDQKVSLTDLIGKTRQSIIDAVNASGLPIDILDLILENIYLTVRQQLIARQQTGGNTDGTE